MALGRPLAGDGRLKVMLVPSVLGISVMVQVKVEAVVLDVTAARRALAALLVIGGRAKFGVVNCTLLPVGLKFWPRTVIDCPAETWAVTVGMFRVGVVVPAVFGSQKDI